MGTSHDFSNNPILESKNQPAKNWSTLGLKAGFIALGTIAIGLFPFLPGLDPISAGIFILLVTIPMLIIAFAVSLAGIVMSIIGVRSAVSSKKTATAGIALNAIVLLPLLILAGGYLIVPPQPILYSIDFSPDGKILATGWEKEIRLLDTETGKHIQTLIGHTENVTFLDYSPDGKILASASYDGTVRIWDVATNKELHSFTMDGIFFQALSFSPDGNIVMVAIPDKGITLLDATTYTKIKTISLTGGGDLMVIFSPNGAFVGFNRYSDLYFVNTDDFSSKPVILPNALGDKIAFSPDNTMIAVSSYNSLSGQIVAELQVWNLSSKKMIYSRTLDYGSQQALNIFSVALNFSPDSKKLAYTPAGDYFDLLDIKTHEVVAFEMSKGNAGGQPAGIVFSPDGSRIAVFDIGVVMWNVKSGKMLWQYP